MLSCHDDRTGGLLSPILDTLGRSRLPVEQLNASARLDNMGLGSVKPSLNYISLGLMILVAGLILYLVEVGSITSWWWYVLIGVGAVMLVDTALRLAMDYGGALPRGALGLFLLSVGLVFLYRISFSWPLFVVIVGVALVLYGTVKVTARR